MPLPLGETLGGLGLETEHDLVIAVAADGPETTLLPLQWRPRGVISHRLHFSVAGILAVVSRPIRGVKNSPGRGLIESHSIEVEGH